jgi:hypothetical protein
MPFEEISSNTIGTHPLSEKLETKAYSCISLRECARRSSNTIPLTEELVAGYAALFERTFSWRPQFDHRRLMTSLRAIKFYLCGTLRIVSWSPIIAIESPLSAYIWRCTSRLAWAVELRRASLQITASVLRLHCGYSAARKEGGDRTLLGRVIRSIPKASSPPTEFSASRRDGRGTFVQWSTLSIAIAELDGKMMFIN